MIEKPDPAKGVFETMLVVNGCPVDLEAHLRRLGESLRAVYEEALPLEAEGLLRRACRGIDLGRVRLTVAPGVGGPGCRAQAEPIEPKLRLPAWEEGAKLCGHVLPGGLGAHKWADRSRLSKARGLPLLLDANRNVLEAGWANVFSVRDAVLTTPPLDGRILPGVTRAIVIEVAAEEGLEVEQRRVGKEEVTEADEVFLSSSVRGIQPVRSLDGKEIPRGGIAALLGERLAGRYRTSRTLPEALSSSA